jgi:hypothetical protein
MSTLKVNQITDLNDAERFNITSGTAVASTSGTSIDFTGIPSWVKRITVMLSAVSTNAAGSSVYMVQLGDSGGIENTGYNGAASTLSSAVVSSNFTTGFWLLATGPLNATSINGMLVLAKIDGNTWVASGTFGVDNAAATLIVGGRKTLSDTLDRVRITTVNGTDTFDAGSINILYEA